MAFFVLLISSCKKSYTGDPDVPKKIKELEAGCSCGSSINQYTWRGQTVFVFYFGVNCDGVPIFYDENANKLQVLGRGYTIFDFDKEATFVKIAWRCSY